MSIKLLKYKTIKGVIRCETGLRIGAQANVIEIGGMDNPVIRNPINNLPYIPGSSLKGKIRSLLEWEIPGKLKNDGSVHSCSDKDCEICRIFGPGQSSDEPEIGPSRAIFRDAELTPDSKNMLEKLRREKGLIYVEEKTENVINRITGKAKDPRPMERVPAGTEFEFEINYRIFDVDGDKGEVDEQNFNWLLHGLWLLTQDALGGSGSRGYGKISFKNVVDENGQPIEIKDRYEELIKTKK
jgi:CRISPR-associated protein Csm3